jgi:hypothetical protein
VKELSCSNCGKGWSSDEVEYDFNLIDADGNVAEYVIGHKVLETGWYVHTKNTFCTCGTHIHFISFKCEDEDGIPLTVMQHPIEAFE